MDVEATCDDAHKPGWFTAFVRDESFDLATETCFDHPFLGLFLCGVILIPCQIVEILPAFVHRQNGLNRTRFCLVWH